MPRTKSSTHADPVVSAYTARMIDQHGEFISRPMAARLTGTSSRTISRMIDDGVIPLYKIGPRRALRVRTADVLGLVERVA